MIKPFLWGLFLLSIVLAGCASATPYRFESPLSPPAALQSSPLVTPSPASLTPSEDLPIPTQDPQSGSIEGSMIMQGYPPGTLPATLYLGDPTGANPVGAYVSLDVTTAIRGYLESDGTFVFPNVPPGTYSIVVWTPAAAYIVPDPKTGSTWLVEIAGNNRLDVGHIVVPAYTVQE